MTPNFLKVTIFTGLLGLTPFSAMAAAEYTLYVGQPYVPSTAGAGQIPFYLDLATRIQNQDPFAVNRLLLEVPKTGAGGSELFDPDAASGNYGIQFLQSLPKMANAPEVYAFLDVESKYPWTGWNPPSSAPKTGACADLQSGTYPSNPASTNPQPVQQDMMRSICLAQAINAIAPSSLTGVVYDGQSAEYKFTTPDDITWLKNEANKSGLKLGWISGGFQPVDLSVFEIYDKDQNHYTSIDTSSPETIAEGGMGGITFPGPQKIDPVSHEGEVSANIYQCALNPNDPNNDCVQYNSVIPNLNAPPYTQALQAFSYIYLGDATAFLTPATFSLSSTAAQKTQIVLLFSTQYIGPMHSVETPQTGLQCIDKAGNCNCIASHYNPIASCGDENGFGAWYGQPLTQFTNFVRGFVNQVCPASLGMDCEPGIYEYNYLPQSWVKNASWHESLP